MIRSGYHSSWSPSLRTVLTFALPSASSTLRFMTTHFSRQLYLMQRVCGAMSMVPRGVPARQLRLEVIAHPDPASQCSRDSAIHPRAPDRHPRSPRKTSGLDLCTADQHVFPFLQLMTDNFANDLLLFISCESDSLEGLTARPLTVYSTLGGHSAVPRRVPSLTANAWMCMRHFGTTSFRIPCDLRFGAFFDDFGRRLAEWTEVTTCV